MTSPDQPVYTAATYTPEESIGFLLKRNGTLLAASIDKGLAEYDMTHAQLGIFLRLAKGMANTASDLARCQMTDTGSMTRMLDRLEEKGFIVRSRNAEDRRVVQVALTDKGLEQADRMQHIAMTCLNQHLQGFTPAEAEQFKDFLRRMIANAPGQ